MIEFEWDQNNIKHVCEDYPERKNTISDVESVFYDPNLLPVEKKQVGREQRRYAVGLSSSGVICFVIFTIGERRIRPISCWPANSQTKRRYYENIKD
ncbi:BrnT family toxin [Dyadobacter arcticus]|uniref:BrnT family toxin n=1 Tax=Dyadobacter arcticus TaxID=1078754 RepID=A0ABX0UQM9_9BACT|nr:hypothetical protein [Dyadobacter arcticus]